MHGWWFITHLSSESYAVYRGEMLYIMSVYLIIHHILILNVYMLYSYVRGIEVDFNDLSAQRESFDAKL